MNMNNRYITNQRAHIAEKQKQPLLGFTKPSGEQATWEDIAVTFTDSTGIAINFTFNNANQPYAKIWSTFSNKDRINTDTHDLLFAYALDILKENISVNAKRSKFTTAKKFLTALNENVACASLDEIQSIIDKMKYTQFLTAFFEWLKTHKMLPASISPKIERQRNSIRGKSGDDAIEAENSKLPDEKALLALGALFYDVIPPYQDTDNKESIDSWTALTHSTKIQLDSYVCTMSALAMSSPNRVAAEQVLLTKQRLQSHNGSRQ